MCQSTRFLPGGTYYNDAGRAFLRESLSPSHLMRSQHKLTASNKKGRRNREHRRKGITSHPETSTRYVPSSIISPLHNYLQRKRRKKKKFSVTTLRNICLQSRYVIIAFSFRLTHFAKMQSALFDRNYFAWFIYSHRQNSYSVKSLKSLREFNYYLTYFVRKNFT